MSSRTKVALLFGGRSGEHAISCATAGGLLGAIDRNRFEVLPVGITLEGRMTLVDDNPASWKIRPGALPHVPDEGPEVLLPASSAQSSWRVIGADGQVTGIGRVDVAFPLLHGPYGEDGTIQGALDLLGVRYVGPGVLASAVGMDKIWSKAAFTAQNLPVAPFVGFTGAQWQTEHDRLAQAVADLGWPVFVKPARAGSSLGITKVTGPAGLDAAVAEAVKHDPRVLVEASIAGREIEVAVLGGRAGAPPRAAGPGEIVVHAGRDFYDFEAKYLDDTAVDLICPADLPGDLAARARDLAVQAFQAIGGEGLSRVDFFCDPTASFDRQLVINEINTMPGFTPYSFYPRMWAQAGLGYTALVSELIDLALERPVGLR